jgi:hypothetical protein
LLASLHQIAFWTWTGGRSRTGEVSRIDILTAVATHPEEVHKGRKSKYCSVDARDIDWTMD